MMANIKNHLFWKHYYEMNDESRLLDKIKKYNKAIRKFANNPDNIERLQQSTTAYRRYFVEDFEYGKEVEKTNISQKQEHERRNTAESLNKVFGDILVSDSFRVNFNVDFAKQLHVTTGDGIIDNAGNYREGVVGPYGCSYSYLPPEYIEIWLTKLFADVNQPIEPGRDDWYDVAADFFDRFLFIHPFINGNGRVARLLLSALLINYSVVPLCLFSWRYDARELYINALEEAHNPKTKDQRYLKSFIILAVHYALKFCIETLKIEDD